MADLLSDETGQDSVLDVPMQSLLEFPGVPLTADDAQRLVTETAERRPPPGSATALRAGPASGR
jgi:hypothetical protein